MTQKDKLVEKIESKPIKTDITINELDSYLTMFGFICNHNATSHRVYTHPLTGRVVVLPDHGAGKQTKAVYVRNAVIAVGEVKQLKENDYE